MKRTAAILITALLLFAAPWGGEIRAQSEPVAGTAAQQKMDRILGDLERDINRFERMQTRLSDLGRANENYSDQKNIWLSSTLTLAAMQSICQYQSDLLTLFMDLREKNRKHYYDVRIESLETSILQIRIMNNQIQINHDLIDHEPKERPLIEEEAVLIRSSLQLLEEGLSLVKEMKSRSR